MDGLTLTSNQHAARVFPSFEVARDLARHCGYPSARVVCQMGHSCTPVGYHVAIPGKGAAWNYVARPVDAWVPACGGTEVPFKTRSGRTLLYCWNAARAQHAYLDVGTDLLLTDEEAWLALGVMTDGSAAAWHQRIPAMAICPTCENPKRLDPVSGICTECEGWADEVAGVNYGPEAF